MSIFNWGIYGGYGIAFPVGRYIPKLNIGNLVFSYIFFSNKEHWFYLINTHDLFHSKINILLRKYDKILK